MKRLWVVALTSAALGLSLAGCSKPEPPEKDQPPEPTAEQMPTPAAAAAAADYAGSTVSAQMHEPIDRAKAVEATVLDAAKQQRAEIDAQTAGNSTQPER